MYIILAMTDLDDLVERCVNEHYPKQGRLWPTGDRSDELKGV